MSVSLTDLARVLRRHALLFLLVVGLSALTGVYIVKNYPVAFEARATAVFLENAPEAAGGGAENPYMRLTESLSTTAQVAVNKLTDPGTLRRLEGEGLSGTSEVAWESEPKSPIVRVLVTDTTAEGAQRGLDLLLGEMETWIAQSQAADGVPVEAMVTPVIVHRSPVTERSSAGAKRALAALFASGLGFAVWLCLAVESRSRRNEGAPSGPPRSVAAVRP